MIGFTNRIMERFETLTHSQKAVANYYLEHTSSVAFTTLEDVAMAIGVSTTTIIRFARVIGYHGYSEMQKDLQNSLMNKVSLPERLINTTDNIEENGLFSKIIKADLADITALSEIPSQDCEKAISKISKANNVYLLGLRSSFALAHYMTTRLGQIRPNVRLIQSAGMIFPEELIGCNDKDVCVVFLFPRYSKTAANLTLWLRKRGVHIVLVTSKNYAALQSYGDIILPCSVSGVGFKNSFAAPICLINYMTTVIALRERERSLDTLQQTEEFLSKGYHLGL